MAEFWSSRVDLSWNIHRSIVRSKPALGQPPQSKIGKVFRALRSKLYHGVDLFLPTLPSRNRTAWTPYTTQTRVSDVNQEVRE